jgi:hypothetical protein
MAMSRSLVQDGRPQVIGSLLIAVTLLGVPAIVFGASSSAISQSFNASTSDISAGTILSLQQGKGNVVEPANSITNASNLEGVAADKPLIELSSTQQNPVEVVVSGITPTLVSNINGAVTVGNQIAPSPINGVGMKATSPTEVVGTAQASLDSVTTVNKMVTTKNGKRVSIQIGLVPVAVNATYYSTLPVQSSIAAYVPPFLQSFANRVANGKNVSPLRVLIGSLGLLLGFLTAVIMLYTSLRSGAVSMGRNPLAEKALRHGLIDILLTVLGVLIVTTVAVYILIAK